MLFKEPPPDFKKEIDVVGCYVQHDGHFLLLHRHTHKTNGDTWGLPAGKKDTGETLADAVVRELREETGIVAFQKDVMYFDSVAVRHSGHDIQYHMFSLALAERPSVRLSESEHQEFCWATPQDALSMPLIHDQDECIKLFYKL